ncbi:hypothetical protein V2J09_014426 [Rumex salicifolius]
MSLPISSNFCFAPLFCTPTPINLSTFSERLPIPSLCRNSPLDCSLQPPPVIPTVLHLRSLATSGFRVHLPTQSGSFSSNLNGSEIQFITSLSEGLSTRQVGSANEIQLRIDPMHGDLDEEITGLRNHVRRLKNVAEVIESEAKYQNEFMNQLQMTLLKAQAGVKNNVRRLNKSIVQSGSSHILHVVLFALFCLFLVVMWSKIARR